MNITAQQSLHPKSNILVVGATGGSGREAVRHFTSLGHRVTAFSRSASTQFEASELLTPVDGDVMNPADVDRIVQHHDAVVVTLGISENPLRVRFRGSKGTANNVRSQGTRNVIRAMQRHGIQRLVVQSSYGVGDTRDSLRLIDRLFFALLLKPQIADTELQERAVRESNMDWVIVQPVHLTDDSSDAKPFLSRDGEVRLNKVARAAVARFHACAALQPDFVRQSIAVSG